MSYPKPLESAQVVTPGNSPRPTYSVHFSVAPTAAMDIVAIKAAPGRRIRVRQVTWTNVGSQTAAALVDMQVGTATNVGSGGTSHTPAHNYGFGDGDPDSGATCRFGDTAVAAGFTDKFLHFILWVPASPNAQTPFDFQFHDGHKPPTIDGDSVDNTFVIRHPGAAGAANMAGFVEFTDEPNTP